MATGNLKGYSKGKVSVTFSWDLLEKINAKAGREDTSFAEAVRRIVSQHFEGEQ